MSTRYTTWSWAQRPVTIERPCDNRHLGSVLHLLTQLTDTFTQLECHLLKKVMISLWEQPSQWVLSPSAASFPITEEEAKDVTVSHNNFSRLNGVITTENTRQQETRLRIFLLKSRQIKDLRQKGHTVFRGTYRYAPRPLRFKGNPILLFLHKQNAPNYGCICVDTYVPWEDKQKKKDDKQLDRWLMNGLRFQCLVSKGCSQTHRTCSPSSPMTLEVLSRFSPI